MALMPVSEALERLLAGVEPLPAETVAIGHAAGRVLAKPIAALRTQPPFDASAMDGYAVRAADVAKVPARLTLIGESAAGLRYAGSVGPGQAVRIFTGAPVPDGADTILIQENSRHAGDGAVEAVETVGAGQHIRRRGLDFLEGDALLPAGRVLDAAALSLAAAANHPTLEVVRRPVVAILATGDELLQPGSAPGPDQIIASNSYGVAAIARDAGAETRDLGIAPDRGSAVEAAVASALDGGADVIVTLGGASVGDRDLVQGVLVGMGMELDFWKIAMRPGKPLMLGRFGEVRVLGLPGNPVSSLVCSHLFLAPLIARLGGRAHRQDLVAARLATAMPANDGRQDYVRALAARDGDVTTASPFDTQDSSMLRTLAEANCLIVRPPHAPAATAGDLCEVLVLRPPA